MGNVARRLGDPAVIRFEVQIRYDLKAMLWMMASICCCCAALTYAGIPGAIWCVFFCSIAVTLRHCLNPSCCELIFELLDELGWWTKIGLTIVSVSGCSILSFAYRIDLAAGFTKQQVEIFNPSSLAPVAAEWLPLAGLTPIALFVMLRICTNFRF